MLTSTYTTIGQRIKKYRIERGMSQDQLAEGICSRQTIGFLEHGRHLPSVDFLQKIADRLSIPFHEIMVDETKELEAKVQLDIIKVYIERGDYQQAFPLLEDLLQQKDILEYQRRELLLCQAECLMRTGMADAAVLLLSNMQQELENNRESDDRFMATLYDKLGSAHYFNSNMAYAHSQYQRAYQICKRFPDADLLSSKVSFNLGTVCIDLGLYSEALAYLTNAHQFFEKAADPKRLATTLFSLGLCYHALKDLQQAGIYLEQSLELFKSLNIMSMARRIKQQYAYYVIGPQNPERALDELIVCAADFKDSGDTTREAYTYSSIASIYLELEKVDSAEKYTELAISLIDAADNDFRFAYIYRTAATFMLKVKRTDESIEYAFKSANIFDKMGIEREAANSLRIAVDAYQSMGHVEKALSISQQVIEKLSCPSQIVSI